MLAYLSKFIRERRNRALVFAATFLGSVLFQGMFPSIRDQISWHAQHELCRAAASGATRKMKLLLFLGANPDGWNTTYKPIFFAARNGQSDAVELLLSEGVDINSTGAWNQTPLTETVSQGHTETATLLLDRGAKLCFSNTHAGAALWQATIANRVEVVRLLMKHGARDCPDAESALSLAVENAQTDVVRALLAGGVDPVDVSATHLVLPLTAVARRNGDQETLRLLKAAGAK